MKTENFHLILYKITATTTYQSQSGKQGEDFPHTCSPPPISLLMPTPADLSADFFRKLPGEAVHAAAAFDLQLPPPRNRCPDNFTGIKYFQIFLWHLQILCLPSRQFASILLTPKNL